jgi:hypothetical protein
MSQIGEASSSGRHMYIPRRTQRRKHTRLGVVLNAPALNLLSTVRTAGHRPVEAADLAQMVFVSSSATADVREAVYEKTACVKRPVLAAGVPGLSRLGSCLTPGFLSLAVRANGTFAPRPRSPPFPEADVRERRLRVNNS